MTTKPVQIEVGEWYFKGCFIQAQNHPKLKAYVVFKDTIGQEVIGDCMTFIEAKKLCRDNEVKEPYQKLENFLK